MELQRQDKQEGDHLMQLRQHENWRAGEVKIRVIASHSYSIWTHKPESAQTIFIYRDSLNMDDVVLEQLILT